MDFQQFGGGKGVRTKTRAGEGSVLVAFGVGGEEVLREEMDQGKALVAVHTGVLHGLLPWRSPWGEEGRCWLLLFCCIPSVGIGRGEDGGGSLLCQLLPLHRPSVGIVPRATAKLPGTVRAGKEMGRVWGGGRSFFLLLDDLLARDGGGFFLLFDYVLAREGGGLFSSLASGCSGGLFIVHLLH
jgi:hypothetical protein